MIAKAEYTDVRPKYAETVKQAIINQALKKIASRSGTITSKIYLEKSEWLLIS